MKKILLLALATIALTFSGCYKETQEDKDSQAVAQQQSQYAKAQPIPAYDWSLERELLIKLYNLRNDKVATYSVWRSDYGMIEGHCASMGFGMPYDTSLTNPFQISTKRINTSSGYHLGEGVVGQSEPNGIFASTNTAATWIMCVSKSGSIEPHYVESKVTTYPYAITVDYKNNRVTRKTGSKSISLK